MTLEEILKAKGQTPEQIQAILTAVGPAKSIFEETLQTAEQKNTEAAAKLAEATEKETKLNKFWQEDATPQINEAFSKVATAEAERDFYRKQAESAKTSGFLPKDAPGYVAPGADGKPVVVAGGNEVPGSPKFLTIDQGVSAIGEAAYLLTEHQRLFNEPLPDLTELMTQAGTSRRRARDVWSEKYKVPERRQTIQAEARKKHDDGIREEERKKVATEYAQKYGNEGTRPMVASRFPNYAKDEKTGGADKMAWTRGDKREKLRSKIMEQVEKETGHRVQ